VITHQEGQLGIKGKGGDRELDKRFESGSKKIARKGLSSPSMVWSREGMYLSYDKTEAKYTDAGWTDRFPEKGGDTRHSLKDRKYTIGSECI